jgi:hypothetical protein
MGEQASLAICDPSFSGTNPAASAKHNALRFDRTRLWRDGLHERNLELEIRLADAVLQRRLMASPMQLSSTVAARPLCTLSAGLRWVLFDSGLMTTRPLARPIS